MTSSSNPPRVFGHAAVETSEGVGEDRVESYEWRMGAIVADACRFGDGWKWSVGYLRANCEHSGEQELLEYNPVVPTLGDAVAAIESAIEQLTIALVHCQRGVS